MREQELGLKIRMEKGFGAETRFVQRQKDI